MRASHLQSSSPGVSGMVSFARRVAVLLFAGLFLLTDAERTLAQVPAGAAADAGEALTLKLTVELALHHSPDLAAARVEQERAEKSALVARAEFLPNLYAGSGAAYTNGIPETPGGRAPSIFNLTYTQQIFNPPLKGQERELKERAGGQAFQVEAVRDGVILQAATAYLELAKVRHSLALLHAERKSAQQIVEVTEQRFGEGLELPTEVTRARLAAARVEQRLVDLEGREDSLATSLRRMTGLPEDRPIEVNAEELPAEAEQAGVDAVAHTLANNPALKQAESELRARELRLKGESEGRWPTLQAFSTYSVLSKFNNWEDFFKKFQRNNINAGVQVEVPIFSARTRAAEALARTDLKAADLALQRERADLGAEARRQAHRTRELDATREVTRLELQLAQQQLGILQSQFQEGRASLRDLEKARLEENDHWMEFLDAKFACQHAQLELLKDTGELARVFQ